MPEEMDKEEANLEHLGRTLEQLREQALAMTPAGQTLLIGILYTPNEDTLWLSIPHSIPPLLIAGILEQVKNTIFNAKLETMDTSADRLWNPNERRLN